jgi:hypothetical protein
MVKGVLAVTEAPGAKAAKKSDKMLANLTAAVQSGRWAKRVGAVSLSDWQNAMTTKGATRLAAGIEAGKGKMEAFAAELLPFQDDLSKKIAQMPDLTLEDSIARATQWMRGMSTFKKRG